MWLRPKDVALILVAVGASATCIRLGFWQLDRLDQRRALNSLYEQRLALPSIDLATVVSFDSLQFARAHVSGVYDYERQVVAVMRRLNGALGVHIVTPLKVSDEVAVWVNRGWVSSVDGRTADLGILIERDSALVQGYLTVPMVPDRPPAGTRDDWPAYVARVSPQLLAPRFPYRTLPVVLMRDQPESGSELLPIPPPESTDGPHLSYALQWFAFALIALVGTAFLLRAEVGIREPRDRGRC